MILETLLMKEKESVEQEYDLKLRVMLTLLLGLVQCSVVEVVWIRL